jgi:hypothetical protein
MAALIQWVRAHLPKCIHWLGPLRAWRIVGPVESVTGVLMWGLSASFVFAIVIRLLQRDEQAELTDSARKLSMHALNQAAGTVPSPLTGLKVSGRGRKPAHIIYVNY